MCALCTPSDLIMYIICIAEAASAHVNNVKSEKMRTIFLFRYFRKYHNGILTYYTGENQNKPTKKGILLKASDHSLVFRVLTSFSDKPY